ncbi:MAG: serine/threonine protein kinase [Chloroflexi bacterium]|nr:MAG: serine/threonine protein kinase [Chloroflexota bacterium]
MKTSSLLGNRYLLEKTLGTGGMSVVYSARDLTLERKVAVKILREDYSSSQAFRDRFHEEAKSVANLSHPNIVTIHDFGLDEERLYIVMEYVPGTDLKTILQQRGRLGVDEAVSLMIQACGGVGYAHRAGIVHCDIKPQNLLVTPDRRLKVLDFGIARALATIQPGEKVDVVWGSPQYFAPEQAGGDPPSPASDVYSLGVVLFEMLTGRLLYSAPTAAELARMHREEPPVSPRQVNPYIPSTLDQIILKVLSKEPSSRYRTADQFGRVLTNFLHPSQPLNPLQINRNAAGLGEGPLPRKTNDGKQPRKEASQPRSKAEPVQTAWHENTSQNPLDIDWTTWGLALLALLAVGGLIPFLMWVYFTFNPPVP